ncbi:GNAT family N-acetyltransferase [Paenibacillus sonchi]|uniref:GNAT family N-acetyltransferase n=1 Tax=Paenibacillus sonchi TaxID=373687 RepID=UPI001E3278B0|nr:GNAT family N-acetyltransferase [Paenibacillus sonchi]MCE3200339.1 GNAT family N-acetyltransferase [Paenibacillus sonchi]
MKIEALSQDRRDEFLNFCRKYRAEVDESFLYEEDLAEFELSEENPTYVAINAEGTLVAAASLILNDYNRRGRKGRFRIFQADTADQALYRELLQAILPHTAGLDRLDIFVPTVNTRETNNMLAAGFVVERYSYLLVRDEESIPDYSLPSGYEIKPFRPGADESVWCEVRNAGFAKLKGSETPATPEMVTKMISGKDYIANGLLILYHNSRAVGIVRGADDDYEGSPIMNIGPLAVLPEYQGKGLGRILLRAALQFAKEQSYTQTVLCVNAENERAQALYIAEGFKQVEAAACFTYDLTAK